MSKVIDTICISGPPKIDSSNVCHLNVAGNYLGTGSIIHKKEATMSVFYVDDWIEIRMEHATAQLLLKTRQYFYCAYMNFLQNCGSIDKWRRTNSFLAAVSRLFDTLERVFAFEDQACGFIKPLNIGLRPKAVPNKFITSFNAVISWNGDTSMHREGTSKRVELKNKCQTVECGKRDLKFACLQKQFFAVYISQSELVFRKYPQDWMRDAVAKVIEPCLRRDRLTFVILYNKNPDQFCMVALAAKTYGIFKLQEYFKNKVSMNELL